MADSSPSAFSIWLSQFSDTVKDSFLSLGPKPTSESRQNELAESQMGIPSMSSEEKLQFLHTQLAARGLIDALPDRLTPINEEMEDVESRRSVMSSRPPSAGECWRVVQLGLKHLWMPFGPSSVCHVYGWDDMIYRQGSEFVYNNNRSLVQESARNVRKWPFLFTILFSDIDTQIFCLIKKCLIINASQNK